METNMTDVTDFIQAAVADKPVAAQKAFAAAMDDRVQNALTFAYDEVQQQVFGQQVDPDEEQVNDELDDYEDQLIADDEGQQELETEMEDNDV